MDHDQDHDHVDQQINHGHTDHQAAGHSSGDFQDITEWGNFHGSNHNSEHHELVGGRTAITTEALIAYNALRAFAGLEPASIEQVGQWAFDNGLTNNDQAWGTTFSALTWYAMQGAKVGWIADDSYDPQIPADLNARPPAILMTCCQWCATLAMTALPTICNRTVWSRPSLTP